MSIHFKIKSSLKERPRGKFRLPFFIKHFKIILVTLVLLMASIGYWFVAMPKQHQYHDSQAIYSRQSHDLQTKQQQLSDLNKIIKDYNSIGLTTKAQVNHILPIGIAEGDLYVNIEGLAKKVGLTLVDIVIAEADIANQSKSTTVITKPAAGKYQLKKVMVDFSLSDINYLKLKNLFELLEKNLRLFDVQSFSFNAKEGKLDLSLIAYYLE